MFADDFVTDNSRDYERNLLPHANAGKNRTRIFFNASDWTARGKGSVGSTNPRAFSGRVFRSTMAARRTILRVRSHGGCVYRHVMCYQTLGSVPRSWEMDQDIGILGNENILGIWADAAAYANFVI